MLHNEADTIAAFATAKTFVDLFSGRDRERRRFLIMKWAETEVIGASFLQFYKFTYHIKNIDTAENLLYGSLCYHWFRTFKNNA